MTKQEWKLLKEIREVKQLDPSDQSKYWNNKFEKATSEEDSNLREIFKSLERITISMSFGLIIFLIL